jgi:hypothetical protein
VIQPLTKLSETRRKQILSHVVSKLEPDEAIVSWGRVRHPDRNTQGFLYLTSLRGILRWRDEDDLRSVMWSDVTAWGVNKDSPRGPILVLETGQGQESAQLQTGSKALASGAGSVIRALARLVPRDIEGIKDTDHGRAVPEPELVVAKEKLGPQAMARKIALSILAMAVLIGALLIIPLPGPWSFLLMIGAFALLAREYDWAEDVLDWIKEKYEKAKAKVRSSRSD